MNGPAAGHATVMALNSGSSSLKFGMYRTGLAEVACLLTGSLESIGKADSAFHIKLAGQLAAPVQTGTSMDIPAAIRRLAAQLHANALPQPQVIGHRIVHGGPVLTQHCLIDNEVMRALQAASRFAPLHIPRALATIRAAQTAFPGCPQFACFDTQFHTGMPDLAAVLPIPKSLQAQGIHRYGFHGLSCESILMQLDRGRFPSRLIIAHLGNGASVTAIRDGKSIDTSMGLTPCGGTMMGTRSGDLDPGVMIHLLRTLHFDADRLEVLLDEQSGLLGVSGLASDMRQLHAAADAGNGDARLAIGMFGQAVAKQIAGMVTVLDGVDMLIFTGGIGEHDARVRADVTARLRWLGIELDTTRNRAARNPLSSSASRAAVLVLPSQEDEQIARHAANWLRRRH